MDLDRCGFTCDCGAPGGPTHEPFEPSSGASGPCILALRSFCRVACRMASNSVASELKPRVWRLRCFPPFLSHSTSLYDFFIPMMINIPWVKTYQYQPTRTRCPWVAGAPPLGAAIYKYTVRIMATGPTFKHASALDQSLLWQAVVLSKALYNHALIVTTVTPRKTKMDYCHTVLREDMDAELVSS